MERAAAVNASLAPIDIHTPPHGKTCMPTLLVWSGGIPPYYLDVVQVNSTGSENIVYNSDIVQLTWVVDVVAGIFVRFILRDSLDGVSISEPFPIYDGSQDCHLHPLGRSTTTASIQSATSSSAPRTNSTSGLSSQSQSTVVTSIAASSTITSTTSSTSTDAAASIIAAASTSATSTALHPSHTAAITGGVVGGIALSLLVLFFFFKRYLRFKRRRIPTGVDLDSNDGMLTTELPPHNSPSLSQVHEKSAITSATSSKALHLRQAEHELHRQEQLAAIRASELAQGIVPANSPSDDERRAMQEQMAALQAEVTHLRNENIALVIADTGLPPAYEEPNPASRTR